jgi:hypothetical protein
MAPTYTGDELKINSTTSLNGVTYYGNNSGKVYIPSTTQPGKFEEVIDPNISKGLGGSGSLIPVQNQGFANVSTQPITESKTDNTVIKGPTPTIPQSTTPLTPTPQLTTTQPQRIQQSTPQPQNNAGMVQTSPGQYVNPAYINQNGIKMAQNNGTLAPQGTQQNNQGGTISCRCF